MWFKVIITSLIVTFLVVSLLVRFVSAESPEETVVDGGVLIFVSIFGFILVSNVRAEVKRKMELKKLTQELGTLTNYLQEKVDEQTRDIKRAYDTERGSRLKLEELDAFKIKFILETQRYLSPPIRDIKNNISFILKNRSAELGEALKTSLNKINDSDTKLDALVGEFIEVTNIEFGSGGVLKKTDFSIKDLISEIVENYKGQLDSKSITFRGVFPTRYEDNIVSADREKFGKALANVIDNAIRYNKNGGSVSVRVEKNRHPIENDKWLLKVVVEDTGVGITKEEAVSIFTSYFERGEEAQKLYTTGCGIGLKVARSIISAHGGRIFAQSSGKGTGSKFFIEVPVE